MPVLLSECVLSAAASLKTMGFMLTGVALETHSKLAWETASMNQTRILHLFITKNH